MEINETISKLRKTVKEKGPVGNLASRFVRLTFNNRVLSRMHDGPCTLNVIRGAEGFLVFLPTRVML